MRRGRGFTLVELAIVSSLISMVFLIAYSMLNLGAKSLNMSAKEYELQSSVRLAAQTATSKIRYSTAVFTIPKTSFRPDNLSEQWDYLGIEDVTVKSKPASQIVQYIWNEAAGTHERTVIVQAREDITYSFVFSKDISVSGDGSINSDRLLNYKIEGYLNGNVSVPYITVDGLTLAANSLQVIDSGTDLNQATAIACRSDKRPETFVGHVAMVLDCSGSMEQDMDGNATVVIGQRRIDILRDAAESLINQLSACDNIDVSIIPFSSSANNPGEFKRTSADTAGLIDQIEALEPKGGTNPGDALRRAYYQLTEHNAKVPIGAAKNYLIVLVDGDTTLCSINSRSSSIRPAEKDYFMSPGNIINDSTWLYLPSETSITGSIQGSLRPFQLAGAGDSSTISLTTNYLKKCASDFFASTNFARPFLIALSESVSTQGLTDIASGLNAPASNVFRADDLASLNAAFTSIMNEITNELWHLNGPEL
ncbi:MAG: VWA domain-containing protein [Clostridiales bacterium]|jgi:prepilin-type N-terminal cleavage/methylation domain-containing protein|nr:VWA domain-containing protein [Clostridiales bacterium]